TAIHEAYQNGATISGTSAGAAVMSKYMITGNQLIGDTTYNATFDRLWKNNIEFTEGLGLLDSIIIDQHFIVRSRYNRLLSALYAFPAFTCIGIDESTAIIFHKYKITVAGKGQVIVFSNMENRKDVRDMIKFSDIHLGIFTAGDTFGVR
ncbi:MAG: Type 1 glutamine amidotransferase-like domain-containing protein, partial [Chitinophagaceae bacterium]